MNNESLELHYKRLCILYSRYRQIVNSVANHAYTKPKLESKINELDGVMQEIERLPISWSFYTRQLYKFMPDFENLIVFYSP